MTPMVRWGLALLAAATSITALAAVGRAWRTGALAAEGFRQPLLVAWSLLIPVVMWSVLAWTVRRFASDRPELAPDHKRHLQGALGVWFVVLTALEGWLAYNFLRLGPPPLDRESFARLAFVVMGVAMAVRGNFVAKVSPPTGAGAPDPGRWTRSMLKTGWTLTLIGAAMVIGAMVLPVRLLALSPVLIAPALITAAVAQRRALRTREAR
jgi:hypothetical protein